MSSSDKTLFAITSASFSATDPSAPLMSFLETADDEGVPQYYEGGGGRSPPSSSGPPSTRPSSLLSPSEHAHHNFMNHHHASYAMGITTTSGITKSANSNKSVDAWRRHQSSEPDEEDDTATAQQPATSSSDQVSGLLHIEEEENESTRVRFEDMTDAEIAQHHFRLAQQHLRAAQRLALAAASAPPAHSSTASSAPSSLSSASAASASSSASISRLRHAQQQFVADLRRREREAAATSWTEPLVVESGWNRPSEQQQQRRTQEQQQQQESGDDSYGSPSSSSSISAAPPTAVTLPSAPPAPPPPPTTTTTAHIQGAQPPLATRFESSASSLTVRSAPLDGGRATTPKPLQPRPVPPPRRATFGSADSKASLGMAVTSSSSLGTTTTAADSYSSSEDPHAASGIRSISPSIYDGETDSILNEAATFPTRAQPRHSVPLKVNYEEEEEEKEGQSPYWDDDDDSRSDFYGAESVLSHVTRATLPEYEDALALSTPTLPPPVPAIPSRFLTPLQTGATAVKNMHKSAHDPPSVKNMHKSAHDPPSVKNMHKSAHDPPSFRTDAREEDAQDFHGFRPRQTFANYTEPTVHRMQQSAQSAIRPAHVHSPPFSNLQPHAYVLSPTGQPIPIYSAAAFSAPGAAGVTGGSAAPNMTATRSNTLPVHAQPLRFEHSVPYSAPYVNSTVEVTYSKRKVSAATPALTSRPSTGSLSQMYHHPPPSRPQSSWSDTSSGADDTRSIAAGSTFSRTKNRMASLRARVPHVRFMSPDPTVLRAPRAGAGSARQAPKTGVRRSASVTAPSSSDSQRPLVIPEHDDDEDHKRQRAMQMSLGMLI